MIKKENRTITTEVEIVCCDLCEIEMTNLDQAYGLYAHGVQDRVLCKSCFKQTEDWVDNQN